MIPQVNLSKAQALKKQTGIEIIFPSFKQDLNFVLDQGPYKLHLAWDMDTDQFVGVNKVEGEESIKEFQNEISLQKFLKFKPHIMLWLNSIEMADSKGKTCLVSIHAVSRIGRWRESTAFSRQDAGKR